MHSRLKTAMLLAGCAWSMAARADPVGPAATAIVPDTAPGLSLGTTTTALGNVTTIDNGSVAGGNLFHSFSTFDLANGDVARWVYSSGNPCSIGNVINRVTGGTPSSLFGMLDSTALPNADFYFINPAGIIFGGQGAQVNAPAAAYFSTAGELQFANGDRFAVSTPDGSTLSVASPTSFGFLGNEGDILFENAGKERLGTGTDLLVNHGRMHLSAANITMIRSGFDSAGLVLAANGSRASTVGLNGEALGLDGAISITDGRLMSGWTGPDGPGGPGLVNGGDINIRSGEMFIDHSFIGADSAFGGTSGDISIEVGSLVLDRFSLIHSGAYHGGSAGSVTIHADEASLLWSTLGSVDQWDTGDMRGGDVSLVISGPLNLFYASVVSETSSTGDGGAVNVEADTLELINSNIGSYSQNDSAAGDVNVTVSGLLHLSAASIASTNDFDADTFIDDADTGSVTVHAGELVMDGPEWGGSIGTSSTTLGDAGDVYVLVDGPIAMADGAQIFTNSWSDDTGSIFVHATSLEMQGDSFIQGTGLDDEVPLTVAVDVDHVLTMDGSSINTNASNGNIVITAGSAALSAAKIFSAGFGSDAGSIELHVNGALELTNGTFLSTGVVEWFPGVSGNAGEITLSAGSILLDQSFISSSNEILGSSGSVRLETPGSLEINSSNITTSSYGTGNAGEIILIAGSASLESSVLDSFSEHGDAGFIVIDSQGGTARLASSSISTGAGLADDLTGFGNAGTILILAEEFSAFGSTITSESWGSGDGGSIVIGAAHSAEILASQLSTSSFGFGNAGNIFIRANEFRLDDAARIFSFAAGWGFSGFVGVLAHTATIAGASEVNTASYNSLPAGSIEIMADNLTVMGPGTNITSENFSVGQAGSIFLEGERIDLLGGARVSTSSALGPAGSIFLLMPSSGILQLASEDDPSTIETSSGPGTGGVIFISSPLAIISNGGSILALGESGGANVQIDTRYFISSTDRANIVDVSGVLSFTNSIYDVSSGTVDAELNVIDASRVMRGQCAAVRSSGTASQLNVRPLGPFGNALNSASVVGTIAGGCH